MSKISNNNVLIMKLGIDFETKSVYAELTDLRSNQNWQGRVPIVDGLAHDAGLLHIMSNHSGRKND
jgi:hypothetical protein